MCVCVCRYSYLVLQPTTTTTTTAGGEQATPPPPPGEGVSGGSGSRSKSSKRRKSTGKRRSRRFGRRSSVALINFSDGSPATTAKVRHTHAHMMYNTYTSHFAHIHTSHTFTFTLHHRYYTVCLHNLCHDTHFTHTNMHTHTHTHTHCFPPSLSLSSPGEPTLLSHYQSLCILPRPTQHLIQHCTQLWSGPHWKPSQLHHSTR